MRVASAVQYTTPGRRVDTSGYVPAQSLSEQGPKGDGNYTTEQTQQLERNGIAGTAVVKRTGVRRLSGLGISPTPAASQGDAARRAQPKSAGDAKRRPKAKSAARTKAQSSPKAREQPAKAKPSRAKIAKPEKVPRTKAQSSPKAREDKNKVCGRPDDNRPKGGGGGSMRKFIPWSVKPC